MEWLSSNWVLLALLGACVAMHLFGHRGHGSHGGHGAGAGGHGCCGGADDEKDKAAPGASVPPKQVAGR